MAKNIETSHVPLNSMQYLTNSAQSNIYNVPPPNMFIPPYSGDCRPAFTINRQLNVLVPSYPPPNLQNNYFPINYNPNYNCNPHGNDLKPLQLDQSCINDDRFHENTYASIPKLNLTHVNKYEKCLSTDCLWIKKWLSNSVTKKENEFDNLLKISALKEQFKISISLLQELELLKNKMQIGYKEFDSIMWNSSYQNFLDIKKAMSQNIARLPSTKILQRAVKKRRKKRECIKLRNKRWEDMKTSIIENRQVLHHKIDTWLKFMQETIDRNKREASLKKEADSVLCDVLRKKADGRRQLALIEALLKLRQLRAKTASIHGQHVTQEDCIRFQNVAENLKTLWDKQLEEYNVEEQGMRVMLNEAVDERDQSQVSRERQVLSQWDKLLFGSRSCDFTDFYLSAEKNVESFINIRKSWDKYVVTEKASIQSTIPVGWVLPNNPSSSKWESLLSPPERKEV